MLLVGGYGRFVEMISQGVKKDLQILQMLSVDDAVRRAIQFEKDKLILLLEAQGLFMDTQTLEELAKLFSTQKKNIFRLIEVTENFSDSELNTTGDNTCG